MKKINRICLLTISTILSVQLLSHRVIATDTTGNTSSTQVQATKIAIYEDSTYGKYVKAEDFGLDKTGKSDSREAIHEALKAANTVQGGAAVMLSGTVYLKDTLQIDSQQYPNVTGLIGSGPLRDSTKVIFDKKQTDYSIGDLRVDDNRVENKQESAILIENYPAFRLGRLALEHAYDSADYRSDNEFYRKGHSYFGRSNGIYINDSSNVTIDNVNVSKFNRAGIYFGSSKAIARRYGADGRPIRESISDRVAREELLLDDPQVPFGVNNVVTNSYLHHNRVAGLMFAYQKNLLVDNNVLGRNGHEKDGGTGYGVASLAGTYNLGVTYTNNYSDHNYRKGYDIHDGDNIVIKNNTSFGDRLYGIEVYNRANPMTNVTIEQNLVIQDPEFKLDVDDDAGSIYNGYMGISIQVNEKERVWKQAINRGQYSITGNTVQNLTNNYPNTPNKMKTFGVHFRNFERSNDYSLTIDDNVIMGPSTHNIIGVFGQTGPNSANKGAGSGDIKISNNTARVDTVRERPIYIKEVNPSTQVRGSVEVSNNQLTIAQVTKLPSNRNMIDIETTNAKTVSILGNRVDYTGDTPWSRYGEGWVDYLATVGTVSPKTSVSITDNAFTTDAAFVLSNRFKNGLMTWGWHKVSGTDQVVVCENTLDGAALSSRNCPNQTTVDTKQEVTTTRYITETKESDELPIGYRQVVQNGIAGKVEQTYEIKQVGDKEVSRRLVSTKTLVESKPEIILIGTAVESVTTEDTVEALDFEVDIQQDPSKPARYQEEIQPGVPGEVTKTYQIYALNGVEKSRKLLSERETKTPQKRIIVVGTAVERIDEEALVEDIEFESEIVYDYTQPKGYEKVKQEGAKGSIEKRYKVTYLNDAEVDREFVSEKVLKPAQKEIIVKGIGVVVKTDIQEVISTKDFRTVTQEDGTQPKGYSKVLQQGTPGTVTKTYEIRYEDNVEISRTLISEVENPKTVDKVIVIGTADISEKLVEEVDVLPYRDVEIEDAELALGEQVVESPGLEGKVVKIYQITYLNGVEKSRQLVSEQTTEPQDRVVRVGGKRPVDNGLVVEPTTTVESTTTTTTSTTTVVSTTTETSEVTTAATTDSTTSETALQTTTTVTTSEPITSVVPDRTVSSSSEATTTTTTTSTATTTVQTQHNSSTTKPSPLESSSSSISSSENSDAATVVSEAQTTSPVSQSETEQTEQSGVKPSTKTKFILPSTGETREGYFLVLATLILGVVVVKLKKKKSDQ